jgi:hypothetical protein
MLLRSNDTVDELLILLSLVKPTEVEGAKILAFLEHRQMDWTLLYDLAKANQTTPLVWINLIRIKAQNLCPAFIAEKFSTDSMAIHEINKNRINTGLKLLQAFSDAGVKVALLKGIFFAEKFTAIAPTKK